MKIQCNNGLCDRLRFIFCYLYLAKKNKKNLTVCWKINKKCNGHFLDLFHPINNLKFTEDDSNVDFFGWKPCLNISSLNHNIYEDLKLLPEIKNKINNLKKEMKRYVSIHVRRTDKVLNLNKTNQKLTPDEYFIDFLEKNKKYKIFLATDCFYIQNKFKEIFKERLRWNEKIKEPWNFTYDDCQSKEFIPNFRPTSLQSTAIDLFTCINSYKFMGTTASGMSNFIGYNRKFLNIKLL